MSNTYALDSRNFVEMDDHDLMSVDGGLIVETLIAIWVLYEVGYACGKAIAHALN